MKVLSSSTVLAAVLLAPGAQAYCNSMGGEGYGPRTSKAYPPGWNNLTRTPHRGWRSWYAYYTHMDEGMIKEAIDALAAKNRTVKGWAGKVSLCDLGYCSAGIDEGWEGCGVGVNGTQHYVNGTPAANPKTFPDMKGLVEYGHNAGLKMGWYFNGCGCAEKREPAAGWDTNYEGDIERLAQFGFDGVKFDGCGRMCNMTFYAELMEKTGKAFEIENCHWGDCTVDDASACPTKDWCPFNWFRTSGDSNNGLGTWYGNLQTTLPYSREWDAPLSQPGCWAYPDMLQVGRLGCSSSTSGCPPTPALVNWTKAHFAAFCIVSSPLVLSIHPSDANLDPILDIVGNKMAMAVNQAWAGHPGTLVRTLPPATPPPPPVKAGDDVVGVPCSAGDATQAGFSYDAANQHILHGGKCLSATHWGAPLTLAPCGSQPGTLYQKFSYQAKTHHFNAVVPANKATPYPCALRVSVPLGAASPSLATVYRADTLPDQDFTYDATKGTLASADATCLAARAGYRPPPKGVAGVQLWAKPLGGGKTAALFINGGTLAFPSTNVSLAELNITGGIPGDAARGAVAVTDVWTGEDAGSVSADGQWFTGDVPSLAARFVVFDTTAGAGTVVV